MRFQQAASEAVAVADKNGREDREQAAVVWLHEAGFYSALTGDEAIELDAAVREACIT